MKLSNATLPALPEQVLVPHYDRSALNAGIVHIGLGNFHRAHQAWYLHRLMQQGKALDWAIIGAGVRPADSGMRDKLLAQDCLTTLVELDPDSADTEIVGAMIDFVPVAENNGPLIRQLSDPTIRIVSLTVTEGGYYRDADGQLDASHPDIVHDAQNPDTPRTAFGAMITALKARRDAGLGPFTGLCCDNLQHNGDVLRATVVGLARLSDPTLAKWIDTNATFPNSMVDCIVPATGQSVRDYVDALGFEDAVPVAHENFRQWVIEDSFCAGRPPWEQVGATLSADVHLYEAMKIRMLNAGHQVLANVGELLSLPTVAACMADPDVSAFFAKVEAHEIAPTVASVPDMTPGQYLEQITKRFSNPMIRDTIRRIAFDGSSRHPGFILPILRDALNANAQIDGLALTEAFWARMCAGHREDGSTIEANDPHWDSLTTCARQAKDRPPAWLEQRSIYGTLADNPHFARSFEKALTDIWATGCRATIQSYVSRKT